MNGCITGRHNSQSTRHRDGLDQSIEARRRMFHDNAFQAEVEATGRSKSLSKVLAHNGIKELFHQNGRYLSCTNQGALGVVSIVPTLLSDLENRATKKNHFLTNPRHSFVSRSIDQLEQSIRSLHHQRSRHDNLYGSSANGVRALTLQFNECSVACVSRWVSGQLKRDPGVAGQDVLDTQSSYFSSVNAYFRQCAVCHKTGHYELECPKQTARQTKLLLDFTNETSNVAHHEHSCLDRDLRPNPQPRKQQVKRPEPGRPFEASLEMCNGCLVEQRAEAWSENARNSTTSFSVQQNSARNPLLDETEVDGFIIRASKEGPSMDQFVSIQVGDLVGWLSSRGDGALHVGILVSPSFSGVEVEGDATVRCIAVIPRGLHHEDNRNRSALGVNFTVPRSDLFSVGEALATFSEAREKQTISTSIPGGGVPKPSKSSAASKSKEIPVRRQGSVKFDRPRGCPPGGIK